MGAVLHVGALSMTIFDCKRSLFSANAPSHDAPAPMSPHVCHIETYKPLSTTVVMFPYFSEILISQLYNLQGIRMCSNVS